MFSLLLYFVQTGEICYDSAYDFSKTCCSPNYCIQLTNRTYTCQDLTTAIPSDIETTTTAEECTANVGVTERFHCYYSNLFRLVMSAMMRNMASTGPVVPQTTVSN